MKAKFKIGDIVNVLGLKGEYIVRTIKYEQGSVLYQLDDSDHYIDQDFITSVESQYDDMGTYFQEA